MKEPRTIQDYKQLTKAFKLKIIKQKMQIEGLEDEKKALEDVILSMRQNQDKLRKQIKNSGVATSTIEGGKVESDLVTVAQINTMKGKTQIMEGFKNGADKFGITLESVYRIADFAYKHEIQADHFRNVLSKIHLGLSPKQISSLIYIFDENCSGYITKQDYQDSLHAYKVAKQQSSTHYNQGCLLKLGSLYNQEKVNVERFYEEMQGRSKKKVCINVFGEKVRSIFGKKILERQIVGAFNAIDLEGQQIIDKQNFNYAIHSSMNRLTTPHPSGMTKRFESNQDWNQLAVPPMVALKEMGNKMIDDSRITHQQHQQQTNNFEEINSKFHEWIDKKIPVEAINRVQIVNQLKTEYNVSLQAIYQQICQFSMKHRITLLNFKKLFENLNKEVPSILMSCFFKVVDVHQKGSIYIGQLIHFGLQNSSDMSIIFRLFGKYFQQNDLNADKFWFLFGVSSDVDISQTRFIEIMEKTFPSKQGTTSNWHHLWNYFDQGKGVVPVANIIKEFSKYQAQ